VIVKYYSDRHESEALPTVVTTAGLTLTLLCVFIIPIDILSVSSTVNGSGERIVSDADIQSRSDSIRTLYYILYSSVLAFAFGVIPFSYFYYEEFDEDVTVPQRIVAGLKYTIFLVLIFTILLIIGVFVKPGTPPDSKDTKDWVNFIVDSSNGGQRSITFAVACLTILGFCVWITYTAYGLSAFPIGLMKGKRHVAEEASDIQGDLESTREQARTISSRHMTGKKMSDKDQKKLDLLQRQERVLAKRNQRLTSQQKGFAKVVGMCKPFAFVFGILFMLISLLIIISLLLTLVDKIGNSCGAPCGFFAKYPKVPNPIDLLLWNLAPYFPLDYIALGSLILYIFFCTLSGIIRIGVRFLWVHLYNIRKRQTPPQGLLMATIILMLGLLALNMEILTLAPRYSTFGNQVYPVNGTLVECNIQAPPAHCTMTQIGVFVARIELGTAFFGSVYYFASWAFILFFFIGVVVALVKRKSSNVEEDDNDSDEEEVGSSST